VVRGPETWTDTPVLFLYIRRPYGSDCGSESESESESDTFRERFERMRESAMFNNFESESEFDDCAPIYESIVVETQSEDSEEIFESESESEWCALGATVRENFYSMET